jgi:hypothetical protein
VPDANTPSKPATTPAGRPKAPKSAKPVKRSPNKPSHAQAREGSKKAAILTLIGRPHGATLAEIMKATGWQAHSVRGFVSGTLGKRMGLVVESAKREDGQRVYRLADVRREA